MKFLQSDVPTLKPESRALALMAGLTVALALAGDRLRLRCLLLLNSLNYG